jgi:hypothetical protein
MLKIIEMLEMKETLMKITSAFLKHMWNHLYMNVHFKDALSKEKI